MAKTEHYFTKFEAGCVYHVYNRTVSNELLFRNDDNYFFFLKKYDQYLSDYVETYAWCLMGNHFHLMIRVKENLHKEETIEHFISTQFKRLFQSYALAYNKQFQRNGSLFQNPFKRSIVANEKYFSQLLFYIHSNPTHHEIVKDFRDYKWSSYQTILSSAPTKLKRKIVLNWFSDEHDFIEFHKQKLKTENSEEWIIEN
jgi:REP element-mobilizing transposase RayT